MPAKEIMEEVAVELAQPLVLYTGTDNADFYQTLVTFNGTQQEFENTFMQHNKRQSQSAQMGAGIYATPKRTAALGYGRVRHGATRSETSEPFGPIGHVAAAGARRQAESVGIGEPVRRDPIQW
jgi:hypothetical protein